LFHYTKLGEELEFKVCYGFPLGYPFFKKKKKKKMKAKRKKKQGKRKKKWKKVLALLGLYLFAIFDSFSLQLGMYFDKL